MRYLLDTNVVSELRKGKRAHRSLLRWWSSIDVTNVYLSVMVLGEVRQGIERLRVNDPVRAQKLEGWLDSVCAGFGPRILTVNEKTADIWGRMGVRRTLPLVDSLLAATAVCHNLVLVTRNTRDSRETGVQYLNPFEKER